MNDVGYSRLFRFCFLMEIAKQINPSVSCSSLTQCVTLFVDTCTSPPCGTVGKTMETKSFGSFSTPSKAFAREALSLRSLSKPKRPKSDGTEEKNVLPSASLSPFDKIKMESDKKTAHGHPLILPSPYGEFGPVFDVFALFHNAVKKQMLVAYNILEAMARFKYEVTHSQTRLFLDWFDTFEEILLVLFDIEQKIVFPFLEGLNVRLPHPLREKERKFAGKKILKSLELISEKRDMFLMMPAGESVPRVYTHMNTFFCLIVAYYNLQSAELPALIQRANIDVQKEVELQGKVSTALRSSASFATAVPFVTHWMNRTQLKAWKSAFLSHIDSFRYEQWNRKFAATHGSLPEKICRGLTGSPRNEKRPVSIFAVGRKNMA